MDNSSSYTGNLLNRALRRNIYNSIGSALLVNAGFMVDSIVVAILLDEISFAVISLADAIWYLIFALSALITYGGAIVRSRCLGENDIKGGHSVFSASVYLAAALGGLLTVCCLIFSQNIALLCGIESQYAVLGAAYISGSCLGFIPYAFSQILRKNILVDGSPRLIISACAVSIAANLLMDITAIGFLHLGAWCVGLTTAICYIIMCLILCCHFRKKTNTLHLVRLKCAAASCLSIIKSGASKSIALIGTLIFVVILNNLVVSTLGVAGASALAVINATDIVLLAAVEGCTDAFGMQAALLYGERNRQELRKLTIAALRSGLLLNTLLGCAAFAGAPGIVKAFDITSPGSFACAVSCVRWFALAIPLSFLGEMILAYLQAATEELAADIFSILNKFLAPLTVIILISRIEYPVSIWTVFPAAAIITVSTFIIWRLLRSQQPSSLFSRQQHSQHTESLAAEQLADKQSEPFFDTLLHLPAAQFSFDTLLYLTIPNNLTELDDALNKISQYCQQNNLDHRKSYFLQLAIEEMVSNIMRYGYKNNGQHEIDVAIKKSQNKILLRIRDDGLPFNPLNYAEASAEQALYSGIKLVKASAVRIDYYYANQMNHLVVEF